MARHRLAARVGAAVLIVLLVAANGALGGLLGALSAAALVTASTMLVVGSRLVTQTTQ